ncbi:MAG: hypothetical protein IPK03_16805 [Bacteroidetes bacterium]|nr:hypothetical protein [Bacteroidota bacterium]
MKEISLIIIIIEKDRLGNDLFLFVASPKYSCECVILRWNWVK